MVFDTGFVNAVQLGLRKKHGKEIPFCLLYDAEGSQLYDKITQLKSYYLFEAEKQLLKQHSRDIASQISPGCILVELGCGSADKTPRLLNAVRDLHGSCRYIGIDVSESALEKAADVLAREVEGVQLESLRADYLDGLRIIRRRYPNNDLCILWLGSSIGNLPRHESPVFLREVLKISGPRSQLFVCTDMWKEESVLREAYSDKQGVTERFIKNGMKHALRLLGHNVSQEEVNSWVYEVHLNSKARQIEMCIRFPQGLELREHGIHISEEERVQVEISRKLAAHDMAQIASESGFFIHATWGSKVYNSYLLLSGQEAVSRCWKDTDAVFEGISDWTAKPIPYRHPFCFYYGHVSAFTKLKFLKDEEMTSLDEMFSRGVDPIVSDPSNCHKHPSVPAKWPDKRTLVEYTTRLRAHVLRKLNETQLGVDTRLVSLILEHERMHQETLCYMLAQQRKLDFSSNTNSSSKTHEVRTFAEPQVFIPAGEVTLGCDPKPGVFFWDNELPAFRTEVQDGFFTCATPVSVGEFMAFIVAGGYNRPELWTAEDVMLLGKTKQQCPATWSLSGEDYYVHFPDGSRHWSQVADKPVYTSLMEAEAFCNWTGCRIMTEAEYHRALDEADDKNLENMMDGGWEWTSTKFHPFPGFVPMEEYPEYSTDFFHGHHYVLKGSSPVTHPSMVRASFRNFYQRQYPFVFAKFRCCR